MPCAPPVMSANAARHDLVSPLCQMFYWLAGNSPSLDTCSGCGSDVSRPWLGRPIPPAPLAGEAFDVIVPIQLSNIRLTQRLRMPLTSAEHPFHQGAPAHGTERQH
jgi:hypothetical protein